MKTCANSAWSQLVRTLLHTSVHASSFNSSTWNQFNQSQYAHSVVLNIMPSIQQHVRHVNWCRDITITILTYVYNQQMQALFFSFQSPFHISLMVLAHHESQTHITSHELYHAICISVTRNVNHRAHTVIKASTQTWMSHPMLYPFKNHLHAALIVMNSETSQCTHGAHQFWGWTSSCWSVNPVRLQDS